MTREAIDATLDRLLPELVRTAGARPASGARRLVLLAFRVDGDVQAVAVGTGLPSRDPAPLRPPLPREAGAPVPRLRLRAPGAGSAVHGRDGGGASRAARPPRRRLAPTTRADLAQLLDRLSQRLAVWRLAPRASHWPERAAAAGRRLRPRGAAGGLERRGPGRCACCAGRWRCRRWRCCRTAPPFLLRLGRASWRVLRAEGPERIEPEWWRDRPDRRFRDYYRVELAAGARLWVCRSGHVVPGEAAALVAARTVRVMPRRLRRTRRAVQLQLPRRRLAPGGAGRSGEALGLAAIGIADRNSFAGVVRGHVAAEQAGLRFVPGARSACRTTAASTSPGPPTAPPTAGSRGCSRRAGWTRRRASAASPRDDLLDAAEGWVMALRAAADAPDAAFADRLRRDAAALRGRLALPLFCAAVTASAATTGSGSTSWPPWRARPAPRCSPPATPATTTRPPPPRRRADRHPPPHHRGRAGLRRRAECRGAPQAGRRDGAGSSPATRRWPTPRCACSRPAGFSLDQLRLRVPGRDPGARAARRSRPCERQGRGRRARALARAARRADIAAAARPRTAADRAPRLRALLPDRARDRPLRRGRGILCQGRGSAANRAVCYVLGITAVDPTSTTCCSSASSPPAAASRPTSTSTSSTSAARR